MQHREKLNSTLLHSYRIHIHNKKNLRAKNVDFAYVLFKRVLLIKTPPRCLIFYPQLLTFKYKRSPKIFCLLFNICHPAEHYSNFNLSLNSNNRVHSVNLKYCLPKGHITCMKEQFHRAARHTFLFATNPTEEMNNTLNTTFYTCHVDLWSVLQSLYYVLGEHHLTDQSNKMPLQQK